MALKSGFAGDLMALWFQAPMVMASRMGMLATSSLESAKAQAEFTRMFSEKAAAATESMIAMQFAIGEETMRALMHPGRQPGQAARDRVIARSIRPYGKRVRANARRLGR